MSYHCSFSYFVFLVLNVCKSNQHLLKMQILENSAIWEMEVPRSSTNESLPVDSFCQASVYLPL